MATLPTGTISFLDLQNYYGGTNPISLSEYYGETYQIPSSGTISLNTFRGKPGYYGDRMLGFSGSFAGGGDFTLTISTTGSAASYSNGMSLSIQSEYQGMKGASNATIALFTDHYRTGSSTSGDTDDLDTGSDHIYWVSISNPGTSHGYGGGGPTGLGPVLGYGASNGVSALFGGGVFYVTGGYTYYTGYMHRCTISTTASATATGGVNDISGYGSAGGNCPEGVLSDGTRGVWVGGTVDQTSFTCKMTYQTITSNSNAVLFGILGTDYGYGNTNRRTDNACAEARERGLIAGGYTDNNRTNRIDYITIGTTSNSVNFGDLRYDNSSMGAGGNGNRCVFTGGTNVKTHCDYVNPFSTSNATNFGSLPYSSVNPGHACGNI